MHTERCHMTRKEGKGKILIFLSVYLFYLRIMEAVGRLNILEAAFKEVQSKFTSYGFLLQINLMK